jgi:hypothetical protein
MMGVEELSNSGKQASALLAVMPEGIGDLSFGSEEWVSVASDEMALAVNKHKKGLSDLGEFVFCEVAHNPPAYLRSGDKLAWHARFNNGSVEVAAGELDDRDCDYKMEGDHSVISNFSRILNYGKDPHLVSLAQGRLARLSRWKLHGEMSDHPVLAVVLRSMHDAMAYRTMPRFTFMTPEWVSSARFILSSRATSEKYAESIKGIQFTFSEEFINTPTYAFPDGSHGGFWARFDHGEVVVGAGPLPDGLGPADQLTKGEYVPVVPVGRTVNASMTEEEQVEQKDYSKEAFSVNEESGKPPVEQSSPSGKGAMPTELARIFVPLHDELSKRTSGELPSDFDKNVKDIWSVPLSFDRASGYDVSWLRYDQVDIYGESR